MSCAEGYLEDDTWFDGVLGNHVRYMFQVSADKIYLDHPVGHSTHGSRSRFGIGFGPAAEKSFG